MKLKRALVPLACMIGGSLFASGQTFRDDKNLGFHERAKMLVSQLTLEEKVKQIGNNVGGAGVGFHVFREADKIAAVVLDAVDQHKGPQILHPAALVKKDVNTVEVILADDGGRGAEASGAAMAGAVSSGAASASGALGLP